MWRRIKSIGSGLSLAGQGRKYCNGGPITSSLLDALRITEDDVADDVPVLMFALCLDSISVQFFLQSTNFDHGFVTSRCGSPPAGYWPRRQDSRRTQQRRATEALLRMVLPVCPSPPSHHKQSIEL